MIFDLRGSESMTPQVGIFYSMVEGNYNRLKSIVQDMQQSELDYKGPDHKYNSTSQLIRHLSYVDLKWVYRIKGEDIPEYLEEKYGPMVDKHNNIPQSRDNSLKDLLADYNFVINLLESGTYLIIAGITKQI